MAPGPMSRRKSSASALPDDACRPASLDTPNLNNDCVDPHPNAVIRFQRVADNVAGANACANAATVANLATLNLSRQNFWPNVLYDPREGTLRDDDHGHFPPNGAGCVRGGRRRPTANVSGAVSCTTSSWTSTTSGAG